MVWGRVGEPILVIADRYGIDMILYTHGKIKDGMMGIMIEKRQLIYDVLKTIEESSEPLGALYLSNKLDIPSATIGRVLLNLEFQDFLQKVSNKGRVLTEAGKEHLKRLEDEMAAQESALELYRLSQCFEKKTVLDMLYARRTIEMATVSLAAERISEEQLEYLDRLVKVPDEKKLEGHDIDFDFHLAIAHISDNRSYEQILKLLLTKNSNQGDLAAIAKVACHVPNYHQHSVIVDALRRHDRRLSKVVMKEHIDSYIDYIDRNL